MRLALLACVAFAINASSFVAAEDTPPPQMARDMLIAAADLAAAHADTRFAYTVDYWGRENDEEVAVKVRYDPRLPVGERWRLVGASLEDLDKDLREEIEDLEDRKRPDGKLVYNKIGDVLAGLALVEETDAYAIFRGPVNGEDLPEDVLQGTITLNKTTGHIERIELRALEPFKPAPIAKVKQFYQDQRFAPPLGDGPALLVESENDVSGKAMFKKFSNASRRRFSDIELVDPADIASAE